jgi:hypothetical protein
LLRAGEDLNSDLTLFVHLLDEQGGRWGQMDQPPLDGWYPTSQWAPGERVAQTVPVDVAPDAPPGEKLLAVGLYGDDGRVPLRDGAGAPLGGDQVILTPRPVVRWAPLAAQVPESPVDAQLGGVVALEGYDLNADALRPGENFDITFHWRGLEPMLTSYTVFVHLVDDAGEAVAQQDQRPGAGRYPTTGWTAGETIVDQCTLSLPAALPAGEYRLRVGMYDLATAVRLPVVQYGRDVPGGFLTLGDVIEVRP